MIIKSMNPMIVTDSPEEMLPLYVKTMGFKLTHNLEFPDVNLLVLEKDDIHIDVVVNANPKEKHLFKRETYAVRINVEDYDQTLYELLGAGCKVFVDTIELSSAKFCLLEQPNGLLLGIMKHK